MLCYNILIINTNSLVCVCVCIICVCDKSLVFKNEKLKNYFEWYIKRF